MPTSVIKDENCYDRDRKHLRDGYLNKQYPNTPFSIADRSQNEQKVLLGKNFIEKLGGIIDVTKNNNIS